MDKFIALFLGFGVMLGLYMTITLLVKSRKKSNLYLSCLTLAITLIIFQNFIVFFGVEQYIPHLIFIFFPLNGLVGPLLFFFVLYYLYPNRSHKTSDVLHLSLFAFLLYFHWDYVSLSGKVKIEWAQMVFSPEYRISSSGFNLYFLKKIVTIGYLAYSLFLIHRFKKSYAKHIKSNQLNHISKINNFVIVFLGISALSFIIGLAMIYTSTSIYRLEVVIHLFNSFILGYISWIIISQSNHFSNDLSIVHKNTISDKTNENQIILDVLEQIMVESKPFLNPELKLIDLSVLSKISPSQISASLNGNLSMSFSDFINGYRINEFLTIMKSVDGSKHSIMSAAYEAGFNSKSTFNRVFKKVYKDSPSEYLKRELRTKHSSFIEK